MVLQGKRVLIGITGGIAAYKVALLIRLLKKQGAEVRCIMTPASVRFITPLTIATLSQNEVGLNWMDESTGLWTNHVAWAEWADVFLITPLTASTLSKLVTGQSDNFLTAVYLSARCPIVVAPAMDLEMYAHPTTKRNLKQLEEDGVHIIPAQTGFLASGLEGLGRMEEPELILEYLIDFFHDKDWKGIQVLLTAGPTYEAIDPVRFIGNHSSGKMGFALAEAAARRGALVTLITGPSKCSIVHKNIQVIRVNSANEMLLKVQENWSKQDVGIFSAAVADYRPDVQADQKIKKNNDQLNLTLVKNPDILSWSAQNKNNQFVVGFALETQNGLDYAKDKLVRKKLDAIVLNELNEAGVGFGVDTNKASFITLDNKIINFELQSKRELSIRILNAIRPLLKI